MLKEQIQTKIGKDKRQRQEPSPESKSSSYDEERGSTDERNRVGFLQKFLLIIFILSNKAVELKWFLKTRAVSFS